MSQTSTPQRPDVRPASPLGPLGWLALGIVFAAIAIAVFCAKAHAAGQITMPSPQVHCTPVDPDSQNCVIHYVGTLDASTTPPTFRPIPGITVHVGEVPYVTNAKGFISFDLPKYHPYTVKAIVDPAVYLPDGGESIQGRDRQIISMTILTPKPKSDKLGR